MTIDSAYFSETYALSEGDSAYLFNFESIGEATIIVILNTLDENGDPIKVNPSPESYTLALGGELPIYQRGELSILNGSSYQEATEITFFRQTPRTQLLELSEGEPFPTEGWEFAMDKLTLIAQELENNLCDCNTKGSSPQPECQPYSCSAFEDYLNSNGYLYAKGYTGSLITPLAYPLATAPSQPGNYRLYVDATASASLITGFDSPPIPEKSAAISDADLSLAVPPDFCEGIEYCVCTSAENATGTVEYHLPDGAAVRGDHSAEAIIVGYNTLDRFGGSFLRNSGKAWRFQHGPVASATYYDNGSITINIDNTGSTVEIDLIINSNGAGFPGDSVQYTFPNTATLFNRIAAQIVSSEPYEAERPDQPGFYSVVRDITLSFAYNGFEASLTAIQSYGAGTNGSFPVTNLQEREPTFAQEPVCMRNHKSSWAILSWGLGTREMLGEGQLAYERNFASYETPAYCF